MKMAREENKIILHDQILANSNLFQNLECVLNFFNKKNFLLAKLDEQKEVKMREKFEKFDLMWNE